MKEAEIAKLNKVIEKVLAYGPSKKNVDKAKRRTKAAAKKKKK